MYLERDSNVTWHLSRELSLRPVTFRFGEVNTCYDGICHIQESDMSMNNAEPPH